MASRALTARLMIAFSSWFGSTAIFHRPPASTVSMVTVSPMVRRSSSDMLCTSRLMSTALTSCGCWRENVSSRCTSVAARSEAWRAESSRRLSRGLSPPMRCIAMSMLPRMTVSMLLKSWAMPPDSRPTASIFCAWRSACSVDSRRTISCCRRRVRRSAIRPRPNIAAVAGSRRSDGCPWSASQVAHHGVCRRTTSPRRRRAAAACGRRTCARCCRTANG